MSWDEMINNPFANYFDALWAAFWSVRYAEERSRFAEWIDLGGEG